MKSWREMVDGPSFRVVEDIHSIIVIQFLMLSFCIR